MTATLPRPATPGFRGLLVPVLRNVRPLSILDLAEALQDLTERSRERKVSPAEVKGGTFTVTNYGALGGIWGTPVINPPQVAILGVGRIEEMAVIRDGAVAARPIIPLSLTFDHRFIDGATAQRFLNDLVKHLENPDIILLDMNMPVMDGLTALRNLAALDPGAKVVMVTSLGGVGDKYAEAIKLGARSVISKPFEAESVLKVLRAL